jgi:transcriptional regulator with XRE-family HTH domain
MNKRLLSITVGDNVRIARLKLNLSQEKLAELADVHRNYIGMVERAERNVTILSLEKIANALKLDIRDLLAP